MGENFASRQLLSPPRPLSSSDPLAVAWRSTRGEASHETARSARRSFRSGASVVVLPLHGFAVVAEVVEVVPDRADEVALAAHEGGHVLAAADLFVLPSYSEGMSISLLEAMAAGLPVVATDIPGNRALVRHEQEGLLVPVRDATSLAAAIGRIFDSAAQGVQLGAAGRMRAAEEFSLENSARAHLELIESLTS